MYNSVAASIRRQHLKPDSLSGLLSYIPVRVYFCIILNTIIILFNFKITTGFRISYKVLNLYYLFHNVVGIIMHIFLVQVCRRGNLNQNSTASVNFNYPVRISRRLTDDSDMPTIFRRAGSVSCLLYTSRCV